METDIAYSQQVLPVPETKLQSRQAHTSATVFAVTDDFLVREARTQQIRQNLRASTAVQTYVASDAHIAQWFSTLFRKKHRYRIFLNEKTFLQSFLARKKAVVKASLPQYAPTATKVLLLF